MDAVRKMAQRANTEYDRQRMAGSTEQDLFYTILHQPEVTSRKRLKNFGKRDGQETPKETEELQAVEDVMEETSRTYQTTRAEPRTTTLTRRRSVDDSNKGGPHGPPFPYVEKCG